MLLTGGGTAGHVTPLLAVAAELKKRDKTTKIKYIGSYGDRFCKLALDSPNIDSVYKISAGKFRRYHGFKKSFYIKNPGVMIKNFRDSLYFLFGTVQSLCILAFYRPNVVFVKGGFVGLPVGLAAAFLRIPIVTHDSDTIPGLTNRILSRFAKFMAVAMPPEHYKYPKKQMRYTGLPVRPEFIPVTKDVMQEARTLLSIPREALIVTVIGGSLGAMRLNNAIIDIAPSLLASNRNIWLLHVTGSKQYEEIKAFYKSLPKEEYLRTKCWPFLDDVHQLTAAATIVVSRAGSSIHELSVQQKCVILVPNPVLTGGHQTINAKLLKKHNAAVVVSENQLLATDDEQLSSEIRRLLSSSKERHQFAEALSNLAVPEASIKIVDVIYEAVGIYHLDNNSNNDDSNNNVISSKSGAK